MIALQTVKQRIARNFSKAANSYNAAATLQQRVADQLLQQIPSCQPQHIVDLGTGTGYLAQHLTQQYSDAVVLGLDLANGMLNAAKTLSQPTFRNLQWCGGDIEYLPLQPNSVELLVSSLAIQWCDFNTVLNEAFNALKPNGYFVFSTLAQGSLQELNSAWQQIGQQQRVNPFNTLAHHQHIVAQSGFVNDVLQQQTETVYYSTVNTLLYSLKALGVNTVLSGNTGLFSRQHLLALQAAYETDRSELGLPLSYQVLYGVLQKRAFAFIESRDQHG